MASATPRRSRFGMTLVKRLPGPSTMSSASAIAWSTSGTGATSAGLSATRAIRRRAGVVSDSPSITDPAPNQRTHKESSQAEGDAPRGEDAELAALAARGAAVVEDGDHRGEMVRVLLHPAQERGQPS